MTSASLQKPFWYEPLLDNGLVPDYAMRMAVRRLLQERLIEEDKGSPAANLQHKLNYVNRLRSSPIAIHTAKANEQHYEVPAEFYHMCLGPRKKYSSCLFPEGVTDLAVAEEKMLELYGERAQLQDGMTILDLGCGWGSLSLWLAEKYPNSRIFGLSNSNSQREYIMGVASKKGFKNLTIHTGNVVEFDFCEVDSTLKFDRVMSIEMFEHMKNYSLLMKKISTWLKDEGKLFVHIFTHHKLAYDFEADDGSSWMARYFFTGGTMPSDDLLLYFQEDFAIEGHWMINGIHYAKTSEAWLALLDKNRTKAIECLKQCYGNDQLAMKWLYRWRAFYIAVAELFAFNNGNEWAVSHYLFTKK